jgi:beta-glucosidase
MWIDGRLAYEGGELPERMDIDAMWGDAPFQAVDVEMTAGRPVDVIVRWRKFFDHSFASIDLAIEKPVIEPEAALAEAEKLAGEADAVVLLVGTTNLEESEGFDRSSLALQPAQDELVRRVVAVNPRTVVVVSAGSPVLMPWRDDVAAVLLTWFPGQEAGHALADMLLGRVEPGGRLPTTWPARIEDVPIPDTQPTNGVLHYTEGLNIGYRAWLRSETAPAFPFGHGHGYTTWTYLDAEPTTSDGSPAVKVRIHNSGARAGREVVQLYLARQDSSIDRPLLWLGGYACVEAEPGRTVTVVVPVDRWALRHWDESTGDWAVERGKFEVRVGRSIGDLRLATVIDVEG